MYTSRYSARSGLLIFPMVPKVLNCKNKVKRVFTRVWVVAFSLFLSVLESQWGALRQKFSQNMV